MYGMVLKQAMMAMGMSDPAVLRMVDRITAGGFENPRLETFAGESLPIPDGAEVMLVSADKLDGKYTILLIHEKRS